MTSVPPSAALRPDSEVPALSVPAALGELLAALYEQTQRSQYVFASPLGPFSVQGRDHQVPRFVYLGPHTCNESLRLAFLAGFDQRDLKGTLSLLQFAGQLAQDPHLGQGLHLSFFPMLDVLGAAGLSGPRALSTSHWGDREEPEIVLLEQDARLHGYHGFVRIESSEQEDEVIIVRLRGAGAQHPASPGVELISTEDLDPLPVRWESGTDEDQARTGPLSIADDLPVSPFELTLTLPASWSPERFREAVGMILRRFVLRYRGLQAYAQHL